MKKYFLFLTIILLLSVRISLGQTKFTETVTVYSTQSTAVQQVSLTIPAGFTYQGTNPSYSYSTTNIGMSSDSAEVQLKRNSDNQLVSKKVERKIIYRTIYEFSLLSIKYTPTNHVTVTNVKVHYGTTSQSYTFKITQPNSYPASDQERWSTVGSSTSRQTGVTYSGTTINPASGLIGTPITSCLASGYIYLGVASESETTSGSTAQINYGFSLEITYERDNEGRTVKTQNDMHGFTGGQIYWDGNLVSSPQSPTLYENEMHTFAIKTPQTISNPDTYQYIWHQGATYTSKWEKRINTNTPTNLGSNTSVPYTTTWQEVGTITHTAYMRRMCNVTFTGGGGTVSIDGGAAQSFPQTRQVIELNPITATATNYSSGGVDYTFLNSWTTSGGQVVSTTINPSQHDTYTANYNFSFSGSSITLQSDIVVPTGSTFTIPSGTTVTLNNHSIYSTGGTIVNNGSVNYKSRLYSGTTLKGLCPSIQAAVNLWS